MSRDFDAFRAGLEIARALDEREIPYALGGALAYGQHAVSRATVDVDVNVFVELDQLSVVVEALHSLEIVCDEQTIKGEVEQRGMAVLSFAGMRLDLFFPSIDFSWEAERTRVRHLSEGQEVWYLSPEALAVFKLLFFRGKDIVDLERLIATQQTGMDGAYVRAQLVEMMGPDDERVETWDRLWAEFGPDH